MTKKTPQKILLLFLILSLLQVGCSVNENKSVLVPITEDDIRNFSSSISGEKTFYYFSRNKCPYCISFNENLENWCRENNIFLYYFDAQDLYETNPEEYEELKKFLDINGVPAVFLVDNQVIVRRFEGESIKQDIESFLHENI